MCVFNQPCLHTHTHTHTHTTPHTHTHTHTSPRYVVGGNGFAVGNRLSLADVLLHNYLAETLSDAQCGRDIPTWRREPLMSQAMTTELLKQYVAQHSPCLLVAV
jgi:hypothetical protein